MTADAKVGLLLGLTFIVIISFLVNGLPGFFGAREAPAAFDTSIPRPRPNIVIPIPDEYDVRLAAAPPAGAPPLRKVEPPTEEVSFEIPSAASMTPSTAAANEPEPRRRITRYKVKKGESIARIAAKVYGAEIGAKASTIAAIVKANRLSAPDVIHIGQVLEMPDLTQADRPDKMSPGRLIEKAKEAVAGTFNGKTIEYTVKSGDCLSMISAKQLGTCKRVDEILKLNKDRINSPDDIVAGMVLKLPRL